MLKAALIGFGGIAKAHRKAFLKLEALGIAKLVCAYDIEPTAFNKKIDINIDSEAVGGGEHINFYTDLDEMVAKEEFDFVDICVPSFKHRELSVEMLRRGYHVMCEKPMALNYADCEEMMRAAEESGKQLMIGQCLRFYPVFGYIKEAIEENRFGKVTGAFFSRISEPPVWGWENWFMTPERSGGCITDLHVHDIDIIRYLFGEPEAVSCRAESSICVYDTVHTSLIYGGTPITALGDWTLKGIPFQAASRINFEKATLVNAGMKLTVYPKDGSASYDVPFESISGQHAELAYFCEVIEGKRENLKNPAISAARTIKLVEHMRKSAADNGKIVPFSLT